MTLRAKPGYEGPQIILEWDTPGIAYNQVIIQRRADRYPSSQTDGDHIIATSSGTSFADISGLTENQFYYYSLFIDTGSSYVNDSGLKAFAPALGTNFIKTWLYNHIAGSIRHLDFLISQENETIRRLSQQQSGTEYYNINENGLSDYPFQERLLRNQGVQLDRVYSLLKMILTTINPNKMPDPYINSFKDLVKSQSYNFEDIETKRHKLRNAVIYHSLKGTITGINGLIRDVFQGNVESYIYEKFRNIFYVSDTDSTFTDLNKYQEPYFQVSGTVSGTQDAFIQLSSFREISPDRFEININQDQLENLSQNTDIVFDRLEKRLQEYIPASSSYHIRFFSNNVSPSFDSYVSGLTTNDENKLFYDASLFQE